MREQEQEILQQYDIDLKTTRKVRDGFLCETEQGLFLLKELKISEKRLPVLRRLGQHLQEQGYENVDLLQENREGELCSVAEDGTKYILKKWFDGKECEVRREMDLRRALENLGQLHLAMREPLVLEEGTIYPSPDQEQEFARHNRELKKVRSFIREKVDKGSFEQGYLKHFDTMYAWAECALERLRKSNYQTIRKESLDRGVLVHGDYNYHNVLMLERGMATTNFEHVASHLQVADFYYFFRKAMEKSHWDVSLGNRLLEQYQKKIPLSQDELDYISICIAYPEKFWKAANSYYRSRKVWIPAKNLEKLELVIKQTDEKRRFLEILFAFYM